jgi:hypothetical protein
MKISPENYFGSSSFGQTRFVRIRDGAACTILYSIIVSCGIKEVAQLFTTQVLLKVLSDHA